MVCSRQIAISKRFNNYRFDDSTILAVPGPKRINRYKVNGVWYKVAMGSRQTVFFISPASLEFTENTELFCYTL